MCRDFPTTTTLRRRDWVACWLVAPTRKNVPPPQWLPKHRKTHSFFLRPSKQKDCLLQNLSIQAGPGCASSTCFGSIIYDGLWIYFQLPHHQPSHMGACNFNSPHHYFEIKCLHQGMGPQTPLTLGRTVDYLTQVVSPWGGQLCLLLPCGQVGTVIPARMSCIRPQQEFS